MDNIKLEPYSGVISYSGANKYQVCPWMFYQEYVKGVKAPFSRGEAVDVGSVADYLIEQMIQRDSAQEGEHALNVAWFELSKKYKFAVPHKELIISLCTKAFELLPRVGYHKALPKEFQYKIRAKDNSLLAIADFLYVSKEGNCTVLDWKTSKYDYTDHQVRQSDQLKLGCYLCWQETDYRPTKYGYIVMNKETGEVTSHIVNYTKQDDLYIKEKYGMIIRAVREGVFYKRTDACSNFYGSQCWHYDNCWGDKEIKTKSSFEMRGFDLAG